ncbi:MAG: phosphonate C-P lyase system protein PhnH [Nostocales cyanobacterium 94392]|nr:phosphonate C-P lyase system protein PhnH [Nostocales cyanobacterium 94392]
MRITQLPGLKNPVHDAQDTFRALLAAMAQPGKVFDIEVIKNTFLQIKAAYAATCLTLLDLETQVWLQPGFSNELKAWLLFHTGCSFVSKPNLANFALINDVETIPELSNFNLGTAERPETSTTLLIPVESWEGGQSVELIGPGILANQQISPKLPARFWNFWKANHQTYPQGIDVFLFTDTQVMGLPRTASFHF